MKKLILLISLLSALRSIFTQNSSIANQNQHFYLGKIIGTIIGAKGGSVLKEKNYT